MRACEKCSSTTCIDTVCEIIFLISDLEHLGQGYVVEKRDLRQRLRISQSVKVVLEHFSQAVTVSIGYFD